MHKILTDLSDDRLATAVKENRIAFLRHMRDVPGAEMAAYPEGVRWYTPVGHPLFRGAISTAPPGAGTERMIRETLALFEARAVEAFTWWVVPAHESPAWTSVLGAAGLRYSTVTPGMGIDLASLADAPSVPAGVTLHTVDDADSLREWARAFVTGFGLAEALAEPLAAAFGGMGVGLPFRHMLARLDGEPVAVSTLYLGAGVAGIYNVATIPAMRRQGLGTSLTVLPLLTARNMGYCAGILQTSPAGLGLYRRIGFREVCRMGHYVWPP